MKKATAGQIVEIVVQLGSGVIDKDRAQRIIENHPDIPFDSPTRETQARISFEKFGAALGCRTFERYFKGDDSFEPVPNIPQWQPSYTRLFGRDNVCLVDRRVVERVGLREYCKLAGLHYDGEDDAFKPFNQAAQRKDVFWLLFQDGYRNQNRRPADCRRNFQPYEVGLDVVEGISVYAQYPTVIEGHDMALVGSVHRVGSDDIVCISNFRDTPRLIYFEDGHAPHLGAASCLGSDFYLYC